MAFVLARKPVLDLRALYLSDLQDEEGKIKPRLVDINSEFTQLVFQNLHYITNNDYELAMDYVDNPVAYDFNKILNE